MPKNVGAALLVGALFVAALPLYLGGNTSNPPGFYFDEANICYNAMLVARRGADEWGHHLPLYFKASGDFKNPVYIYLLAAVFRFTGPSSAAARGLSGVAGDLTAAAMAWLAWLLTSRRWVTAAAFAMVVLTPALFEMSRLVFEVAVYPLVFALFLLALLRASRRERWNASDVVSLVVTLSLCTYTYSIGRLYGPILAAGLAFFYTRRRRTALAAIVALYVLTTLAPMAVVQFHSGALTARFRMLSYVGEPLPYFVHDFASHYLTDFDPIEWSLRGDTNDRHHVQGAGGSILAGTFVLAFFGVAVAFRRGGDWHRFLIYALILSLVPNALTTGELHTLRSVPFPLLLIAFASIACTEAPKRLIAVVAVLALLQSAWFFVHFVRDGPRRTIGFQAACEPATEAAIAQRKRPIYLIGHLLASNSIWYGALRGVPASDFVVHAYPATAPSGSVVITDCVPPPRAAVIFRREGFWTYVAP